jgi:hypothetical protein
MFIYEKKDPSLFLKPERVMEIYKEVTGREEQWIKTAGFEEMAEEELYTMFSNMEYTRRRSELEASLILKKKPVLISPDMAKSIYKEIMGHELEYTEIYQRMSEQEMRQKLIAIQETKADFERFTVQARHLLSEQDQINDENVQ